MNNEKNSVDRASEFRQATMSREAYQRAYSRRRRMQWLAVPTYFAVFFAVMLFSRIGPVDEERFFPALLLVIYGGMILMLLAVYFRPFFKPLKTETLPDGTLVPPPSETENPEGFGELNLIA